MSDYLLRPSLSLFEFVDPRLVFELGKMRMLRSMHAYANSFFDDPRLVRLVEWPVLFLGASIDWDIRGPGLGLGSETVSTPDVLQLQAECPTPADPSSRRVKPATAA